MACMPIVWGSEVHSPSVDEAEVKGGSYEQDRKLKGMAWKCALSIQGWTSFRTMP